MRIKELLLVTLLCHVAVVVTATATVNGRVSLLRLSTLFIEPILVTYLTFLLCKAGDGMGRGVTSIVWMLNLTVIVLLVVIWSVDLALS